MVPAGWQAGPTLPKIFISTEAVHFNRKDPGKAVHARGFGVHDFECTRSLREFTTACFLQEPGLITPVFCTLLQFYRQ